MSGVRLTVLDSVRVASPCSANWDDMKGDARARHCGQCNLNVYNLSEMTRAEAEAFLLAKEGRLCGRYWQREDGKILTRDCPIGLAALRAKAARLVTRAAAVLGLILTGGVLMGSRARASEYRLVDMQPFATLARWLDPAAPMRSRGQFIMGDLCLPPPPPSGANAGPSAKP